MVSHGRCGVQYGVATKVVSPQTLSCLVLPSTVVSVSFFGSCGGTLIAGGGWGEVEIATMAALAYSKTLLLSGSRARVPGSGYTVVLV